MHVDQVLRSVPASKRCPGHPKEPRTGFMAKLFGAKS